MSQLAWVLGIVAQMTTSGEPESSVSRQEPGESAVQKPSESAVSTLDLQVEGQCLSRARLAQALAAERVGRQLLSLVVRVTCRDGTIDVHMENSHGVATFAHDQDFVTSDARERGLALVIAEQEVNLQPSAPPEEDPSEPTEAEEPSEVAAPPEEQRPEEQSAEEQSAESYALPEIVSYGPNDFDWVEDRETRPVVDRNLSIFAGALVRGYTTRATLVGGGAQIELSRLVAGLEFAFADEASRSARDLGGQVGFVVFAPRTQPVSVNLGARARVGYQSYDKDGAGYVGASVFAYFEAETFSDVYVRLVPEFGRGGFARRPEFAQIQSWFFATSLQFGTAPQRKAPEGSEDALMRKSGDSW